MNRALILLGVFATIGCVAAQGVDAPATAELVAPEEAIIAWSSAANGYDDGIGTLILFQWSVIDTVDSMPMNNIRVELLTSGSGIYLLPESAIRQVDPPDATTSDCNPASDVYDIYACPWYDNGSQSYFQLSSAYASQEGEVEDLYRPNYLVAATDERGILRQWAYVDALPEPEEGTFSDAGIYGSIGLSADSVTITVSE